MKISTADFEFLCTSLILLDKILDEGMKMNSHDRQMMRIKIDLYLKSIQVR